MTEFLIPASFFSLLNLLKKSSEMTERKKNKIREQSILDETSIIFNKSSPSFTEQDFRSYLNEIKNDLEINCVITEKFFSYYLASGVQVPPHYAWRIAIILRKTNNLKLELDFLNEWCRHFPDGPGVKYSELSIRREKLQRKLESI